MELIYNELSELPLAANEQIASEKIVNFLNTFKAAQSAGFKKIRFSKYIQDIQLAPNYSLRNWVESTDQRNLKNLLLSIIVRPFIKNEDVWAEDEYIINTYFFEDKNNSIAKIQCDGLAAASIYDTLAISFSGTPIWEQNLITILKVAEDNSTITINVNNIFSVACFKLDQIKTFVEAIGQIVLIASDIDPKKKPIHLRDDHGKDDLEAFAKKILKSKYLIGVINSLPFNNKATKFIRRIYPNGLIEIVLYWDDRGIGMVLQSTGGNLRETKEIAKTIEEEYT